MSDNGEYQSVSDVLQKESERLRKTGDRTSADVAGYYCTVSYMVPPRALIHESQKQVVLEMLFRLLGHDFKQISGGHSEKAQKMREAIIFLGACSSF